MKFVSKDGKDGSDSCIGEKLTRGKSVHLFALRIVKLGGLFRNCKFPLLFRYLRHGQQLSYHTGVKK